MPTPKPGGLLAFLLRVAPPAPDADAALLARFVRDRDEAAFAALVRRHGPMVFGVCRRRLGAGADAEDAFQATFLALARDAGRVTENLPGWLYRVAYLVALKAAGRRRGPAPLATDEVAAAGPTPDGAAQTNELRIALDAELAALPDRLRAVAVLCLIDGRTNTEAAARLGIPTGTVDSRLSAARKKLRARLARRGAAAVLLGQLADAPAGAGFDDLADRAVRLATGAGPEHDSITSLANGVSTMTTTTRKVLAAGVLGLALVAGTGFGVFHAADPKPADPPKTAAQKAEAQKPAAGKLEAAGPVGGGVVSAETRKAVSVLDEPVKIEAELNTLPLRDIFQQLSMTHAVEFRLDEEAYREAGEAAAYDRKPGFSARATGMTVRDLLRAVAAGPLEVGIEVHGLQIVVSPTKSIDPNGKQSNPFNRSVTFLTEGKSLSAVLIDLRRQTGATIVLDERAKEQAALPVSGMFNDVRLWTVLRVLGDMCELEPVVVDDTVFYLTTPANAARLREAGAR